MARNKADKLPKTVYLVRVKDGDDAFFLTYERIDDIPEDHAGQLIGCYTKADVSELVVSKTLTAP